MRSLDHEQVQYPKTFEDEKVISLSDVLHAIRKYAWLIVIIMVITSGTALGLSLMAPPQYQAGVKILIGQESGFVGETGNVQQLQDLTQTMSQAVRTRPVAEEVIRQQGLNTSPDALLGRMTADQVGKTQLIQVTYTETNPTTARSVANAIGTVFTKEVSEVSPDNSAVTATVWEQAEEPAGAVSPRPKRNAAAALAVGAILGLGVAFLLEYLDKDKKKWEEQPNER